MLGFLLLREAAFGRLCLFSEHFQVIEMPEHNPGQMGGTMRLGKRRTLFQTKNSIMSKSCRRLVCPGPSSLGGAVAPKAKLAFVLSCFVLFLLLRIFFSLPIHTLFGYTLIATAAGRSQ